MAPIRYVPPPPSGMYPPPGFKFESRTEKGLRNMLRGMKFMGLCWCLIIIMVALTIAWPGFVFDSIILIIPPLSAAIILFLASAVSWIYGIYLLYTGRWEFGPVHAHYVGLGFIFAAMFFLFSIAQNLFLISFGFGLGFNFIIMRVTLGIISTLILSATWIFFILALIPEAQRVFLSLTLIVSFVVSLISSFISEISNVAGIAGMTIWLPVLALIFYCYHKTHQRLKNREIVPVFPPPIPMPYPRA